MLPIRSILVVCAGNICRSPMAEYLFRNKLEETHIAVSSAGLIARDGAGVEPVSLQLGAVHGVNLGPHRSRRLRSGLLAETELVLVMEKRHQLDLVGKYPEARGKVFLLGKWIDEEISDPYQQSPEAYQYVYQQIALACDSWIPHLDTKVELKYA